MALGAGPEYADAPDGEGDPEAEVIRGVVDIYYTKRFVTGLLKGCPIPQQGFRNVSPETVARMRRMAEERAECREAITGELYVIEDIQTNP
jgi:hypothetical protein